MKKHKGYIREIRSILVRTEMTNLVQQDMKEPENLHRFFKEMENDAREKVLGVYYNPEIQKWFYELLGVGGSDFCTIDLKDIFGIAYMKKASAMALVHNHPKGVRLEGK